MLKTLLQFLFVIIWTGCSAIDPLVSDEEWSFVCFGDIREGYGIYQKLAYHMANNTPASSFAVCLGDITWKNKREAEWVNFQHVSTPITSVMPMWTIRGNHEGNDELSEYLFRKYTNRESGELYFAEQVNGYRLLFLDTERVGEENGILSDQLEWFKSQLELSANDTTIDGTFVFLHRPVFPQKRYKGSNLRNANEIHSLLKQHEKLIAVFAGHEHSFDFYQKDGVNYVTTGGGGSPLYNEYGGNYYHYSKISFFDTTITLQTIDLFNEVIDEYKL